MNREAVRRAARLYRAFREVAPDHARRVTMKLPHAVARIGVLEFVGYMTTHRGTPALYVHFFSPGSRPAIYAGPDRNQLLLVGGRYKVTGRGITDLSGTGKVVDYTPRFVVVPRAEWLRRGRRA